MQFISEVVARLFSREILECRSWGMDCVLGSSGQGYGSHKPVTSFLALSYAGSSGFFFPPFLFFFQKRYSWETFGHKSYNFFSCFLGRLKENEFRHTTIYYRGYRALVSFSIKFFTGILFKFSKNLVSQRESNKNNICININVDNNDIN